MGQKKSGGGTNTSNKDAAETFWKAVKENDVDAVKQLLPSIDLEENRERLEGALIQAVFWNHPELANLLLSAGINPNQMTSIGTLLMCASMGGKLDLVKHLIDSGADYNLEVKRGTALSAAMSENQVAVIKYLEKLKAYSPPNLTLLYASMHGDIARAKRAIQQGAELDKSGGTFDETPLMAAARKGQLAAVKLLLKHGANPNKQAKAQTALYCAARFSKSVAIFDALVNAGADVHAKHYDETLLITAVQSVCFPMVERLVEMGVDINARDKDHGITALDRAKGTKDKKIIELLTNLGAKADRDRPRALMKAFAKKFGGKIVEHSQGFLLNSRFGGYKCQFSAEPDGCAISVHGLKFCSEALRKADFPSIRISPTKPIKFFKGFELSKAGSDILTLDVHVRSQTKDPVDSEMIALFCMEIKPHLPDFNLVDKECLVFHKDAIKCLWLSTDIEAARPKLKALEKLIQAITRPPQPDRFLLEREWLIKSKPASSKNDFAHFFGGALEQPVACSSCGNATNRMLQMDLADTTLPVTSLGKTQLPVFWCLECLDWGPASYDVSGAMPKLIQKAEKKPGKIEPGEDDLEETAALLVPVPAEKKAGRKSKIGGKPTWIQMEQTPDCIKCEKSMAFVLQLDSGSPVMYGDMGMLYVFTCPECKVVTSLIQSH